MTFLGVIDLAPFRDGDERQRAKVAATIDRVCQESGFLQVTGHGISQAVLDEMLDVTAEFFDLPLQDKQQVIVEDLSANRGYSAEGTEALAYSLGDEPNAPDLFEAFNAGRVAPPDEPLAASYLAQFGHFYAPNVWPQNPPKLREVWQRYQEAVNAVSDLLLEAFAVALSIDPEFFIERTRRSILTTRAINYQRRAGAAPEMKGQMRMGAHTDYGVLTVLLADDVPGLEVFYDKRWQPVSLPSGALMVNLGDMLATWTNDRWVSTLHRVVPPLGEGQVRRRSVAQFLEADPDCLISCLPGCAGADNPARYEPVLAGDYLMAKLMGPREMRKSELGD